jgi:hypothetical protein
MHRIAVELAITVATTAVMAAVMLGLGAAVAHPLAQPSDWPAASVRACQTVPVTTVAESGVAGEAQMCVDLGGIQPTLAVRGLHAGETYTAWLAYFDRPSACFSTPCSLIDLRGDDPVGVMGRLDGAIAPSTGELELRATVRDLHPSPGAQVTLLALGHGAEPETDGRARARQLLTPQMFELGAPMAGTIGDRARGWLHAQAIFILD